MKFPTLYKKSSTGKIQQWEIIVEDNTYWTEHGYINHTITTGRPTTCQGKNIGRANETTPESQAYSEAESKWKKQLDKGYFDSLSKAQNNIVVLPMLAHEYTKRGKDIKMPCFVQPKLDGIRCLIIRREKEVILMSRKGKEFTRLDHIRYSIEIEDWFQKHPNIILDGELYGHTLPFEKISGAVRREKLKPEDEHIEKDVRFNVYDCINVDKPKEDFVMRYGRIEDHFAHNSHPVALVKTEHLALRDHIQERHDKYVEQGYEGIMLRNADGHYALNKRSKDLQKYKNFQDSEYQIVGFEQGRGNAEGTVIWFCKTEDGKHFKVRPRGTDEQRREWYQNGINYIGKYLTVRYQELSADGVPRFPVGIAIRDYED